MALPTQRELADRDMRLRLAKQFLQQRSAMLRFQMDPPTYLAFKLGCSYLEAERLIALLKEQA